jgi:hypothetical protein
MDLSPSVLIGSEGSSLYYRIDAVKVLNGQMEFLLVPSLHTVLSQTKPGFFNSFSLCFLPYLIFRNNHILIFRHISMFCQLQQKPAETEEDSNGWSFSFCLLHAAA